MNLNSDRSREALKVGDLIRLRPRYSWLFADTSGVIIAIKRDPNRPIFDEYTVQFPDGSTAGVFQFQTDDRTT